METKGDWVNVRHREIKALAESLPVPDDYREDFVWECCSERFDRFAEKYFWEEH